MDDNSIHSSLSLSLSVPVPNKGVFRYTARGPILSADTLHSSFGIRGLGRILDRPQRSISLAVQDLEFVELVTTTTEGGKKLAQINRKLQLLN
jgi:hypothetical protein